MEFLKALSRSTDQSRFQVIHLTGEKDYACAKEGYKRISVDVRVFDFFASMHYGYSACDLVISRAGATTITEIAFFQLPAIVIPYPYAQSHQVANAKVLEKKGAAIVMHDEELNADALLYLIELLVNNPDRLNRMRATYGAEASERNAARILFDEAMSLN